MTAALLQPLRAPTTGVGVEIAAVTRTFGGETLAVDGVSLHIAPGAFVALLGPSGCGKSTLLRLVAGLDRPDAGTIHVDGPAPASGRPPRPDRGPRPGVSIAYVFQDAHLLPWRRVIDNAALPLELAGVPKDERRAAARDALAQVGLTDAVDRYPAELSGGMRMRVSLARALVTSPQLLLLDEPFAALDELTRNRLDDQLRNLWLERGMTVLFVTHSITEAAYLAERAVVFTRRPARVVADRAIDLPRDRDAAIRTGAPFARELRALHEALEMGGAR